MGAGDLTNHWPQLSRPADAPVLRVISHGAGVQTTALCLMVARGDLPMVDAAIFADTGNEPRRVYAYLDWLQAQLPFPVIRVRRPGATLGEQAVAVAAGATPRRGAALPPLYTSQPRGMLPKQCSKEFKTRVVTAELRRMLGVQPRRRVPSGVQVEVWLGITKDELQRVRTSETPWQHYRHPLVELDMERHQCVRWIADRQYPQPFKSSCVFCPLRDDASWRDMRENQPDDFADAVAVDHAIRQGWPGMEGEAFVHRGLKPLDQADFYQASHPDQLEFLQECDSCGI